MSIPSLRQKQINEVLNYHRLMDRTVFDRNVRSVHASEQTRSEPHRTDIETEANLRERVDKMKTTLQQLIQVSSYDEDGIDPSTGGESKTMEGRTLDVSAAFMKNKVDSTLASLLSDYNGICQLYDSKNRAKVFSQSEGNALVGIVKELKDPLVEAIGKLMQYKDQTKKYFQTYRVLKTLIDNIESAPPLIKIPVSLLTEPYFIPNPTKVKPVDTPLWKHLLESRDAITSKIAEYSKTVASNATEKSAKDKVLNSMTTVLKRIDDLIKINTKALKNDKSGDYEQAVTNTQSLGELRKSKTIPDELRKKIEQLYESLEKADVNIEKVGDLKGLFDDLPEYVRTYSRFDREGGPDYEEESDQDDDYVDFDTRRREHGRDLEDRERIEEDMRQIAIEYRSITDADRRRYLDRLYDEQQEELKRTLTRIRQFEGELEEAPSPPSPRYDVEEPDEPDEETDKFIIELKKEISSRKRRLLTIGNAKERRKVNREITELKQQLRDYNKNKPIGRGKSKKGGNNHYGDDSVLEPYLSKHLKPSKFHEKIKPVESSSEESETDSESDMDPDHVSSSDESEPEVGGFRKKRHSKKVVNPNTLVKQGKEGVALLEKIMAKPRGGRKKVVKPLVNNNRDKDLWFV